MEIQRQADYYGLPSTEPAPLPPQERVADLLAPAPLWEGPTRLEDIR